MGIFDKLKRKNTQQQSEEHLDNDLLEIVKIVSFGDTEIMKLARQCVENIAGYYNAHVDDYQARCLSDKEKTSFLQWIGCIDLLMNNNYVCECDWKEAREEFVYAISSLQGISTLPLELDSKWFDEKQSVPQWCETLDEKWKNLNRVIAAFDIDSDSYVMFPCKKDEIETLSRLAEHFGYRIDYAKNM